MGLDIFSAVWDFLQQSLVFVVGAIILFLVAASADPHPFFMQYFAKDVGLTVEALHAARGTVEMTGSKAMPGLAYDYNITSKAVLLKPHVEKPPEDASLKEKATTTVAKSLRVSERNAQSWQVRKRYGADKTIGGITVEELIITNPQLLFFEKRNDGKETIRVAAGMLAPSECLLNADKVSRLSTRLIIIGDPVLVTPALQSIGEAFHPVKPTLQITFIVEKGERPTLRVRGTEPELGKTFACIMASKLSGIEILPTEPLIPASSDAIRTLEVTLTHPEAPTPGLTDTSVAAALSQGLEGVLQ
jgi:hypothetical protein